MIHRMATMTEKRFFLTEEELSAEFHMCLNCSKDDESKRFGRYRQYICMFYSKIYNYLYV